MALTPTDLPEPVVPATSRCGMRARSASTGAPAMLRAERQRQRGVRGPERLRLEQLAQVDRLAPRVGQLDADGVAPGHDGGTHAKRAPSERAMSSASPITRADLTPRAGSNSKSVTTGPGGHP